MKIAMMQTNPKVGDMPAIFQKMVTFSQSTDADIVVFPELSVCGYYPRDLLDESWFEQEVSRYAAEFVEYSITRPGVYYVIGVPEKSSKQVGKPWHNALWVINNGQVIARYFKQLLPTYGIFNEWRNFEPGPKNGLVLEILGKKLGFLICEDGWNDDLTDYENNPFEDIVCQNPDAIVSINASPANLGKHAQRLRIFGKSAKKYATPIVYVNQVGGQDEIVYDGASFVMNNRGELAFQAKAFEEQIAEIVLSADNAIITVTQSSAYPVRSEAFQLEQIKLGLRDYVHKSGFKSVVVGSSGGIDSAATIAFSVDALGAENVLAVTMPSKVSSEGSISDSEKLCSALGVKLECFPIAEMVSQINVGYTAATGGRKLNGVSAQNPHARIRGTILMAYSNEQGHLLLTTGNKSEVSVGYCTLYGDTNGGLGLLGDLYKTEIFELCRYYNEMHGKELIPQAIIDKEPSAELEEGQKDSDNLPVYPVLDTILKLVIEHKWLAEDEYKACVSFVDNLTQTPEGMAVYKKVLKLVAQNEYKRRQMPPVIRIRPRAFGQGRQMPLAARLFPV